MTLPEVALANAAFAVPLAGVAIVGAWFRRPAVTHALWLLVLMRLFMPPMWRVPLPEWPAEPARPTESAASGTTVAGLIAPGLDDSTRSTFVPVIESAPVEAPKSRAVSGLDFLSNLSWQALIVSAWLMGTVGCIGVALGRMIALHRLLRHAEPAPATWQQMSDRLAGRLGLRRAPGVWLVRGPVSPLLWGGFGHPRILLPSDLVGRLDGRRRAALLAHELAHLRRGDHLIRWLELAATAAYWWHPIVWVARRGLREAEEQCCDAWVVWALPAARRAYADALVDTVDFLSSASPALPPLASGLGTVRHLKRRVVMIMRGKVSRRMSVPGLLFGLAFGAVLMAITPTWGQDPGRRGPDDDQAPPSPRPRSEARDDEPRPTRRRVAEVDELRKTIEDLRTQLSRAERRLAEVEGRPIPVPPGPPGEDFQIRGRAVRIAPGAPPGTSDPSDPRRSGPPAPPTASALPATPSAPLAPAALDDRRIRDLEKELAALRRDIAEMRREMRRPAPSPAPESRP
jgi:bla regulator protein BlaR1